MRIEIRRVLSTLDLSGAGVKKKFMLLIKLIEKKQESDLVGQS